MPLRGIELTPFVVCETTEGSYAEMIFRLCETIATKAPCLISNTGILLARRRVISHVLPAEDELLRGNWLEIRNA